MPNVVVHENRLVYGGISYWRANAQVVECASIGEIRTPALKSNYLEVKDRIPAPKIAVVKSKVIEIDFTKSSKNAFSLGVSAIVKGIPVKLNGNDSFERMRTGNLKLVHLSVLNNVMMRAINDSPKKLRSLIEWGNDARVAHQVFVVMEASVANEFDRSTSAKLSVGLEGLEATVGNSHSSSGETTVKLPQGSTFAYLLAKLEWDAKLKKNRTRCTDLKTDQKGIG